MSTKVNRKNLLVLPGIAVPFLFFMFYSLGGGRGAPDKQPNNRPGFNTELPDARFDKRKPLKNKLDFYKQADQDSIRRKEYMRQDPYYKQDVDTIQHRVVPEADVRADELLQRLDKLKQSIQRPPPAPIVQRPLPAYTRQVVVPVSQGIDTSENDPQLEKLNTMLDKIIRIQHPKEAEAEVGSGGPGQIIRPDTAAANSLPAVVQENQVLAAGATISLRLMEAAKINGVSFPKDQLAYGVVSISNDRMLVTVNSIRQEQSIYATALQVYDLDGLPGIHIPGSVGREIAKQSVDQSINSLGIVGLDGSPAAQVTSAGVLAARSLLSRKVRMVRISVRAGYQVLLRSSRAPVRIQPSSVPPVRDSVADVPEPNSFIPFLHRTIREEKMELTLQGIYLRDSLLWMVLRLENHSPLGYTPGYLHWSIRDKKQARRTAIQDLGLQPLYSSPMGALEGDSSTVILAAFRPFALPKDKELVLQLAEGNGARELVMKTGEKELLKVRKYE